MTNNEIRTAIAETCGLHPGDGTGCGLPDYPNDRNAMVEAIVDRIVGDAEKEKRFIKVLNDILDRKADDDSVCIYEYEMAQITASADELAEAFLRTFGKWKDETKPNFPALTDYEERVFAMFWKEHIPGYWSSIQLEGDRQLSVVAAGLRLQKKGIVNRYRSCSWGLTELGKLMAEDRQKRNGFKPRNPNL